MGIPVWCRSELFVTLLRNLITMKTTLTFLLICTFYAPLFGQSIHEQQLSEYNASGLTDASDYEGQAVEPIARPKVGCTLDHIVYGWHPYWSGSAYQNYQWDLLSHFSSFSYEVNASTGQPDNTHGWSTSSAVDAALASGNTKVTLCVTLFSGHSTFFGSSTAQQTLITNLINLVQSRGAHGVNIDFEGLPSSQATNFANFMVNLSNQMHAAIPGSEVSTVLYAVDWSGVFDFSIMEPEVDHYIIMGYGYYYGGSATAGPTDPLYQFGSSYNYTLSKSITYYLDAGCPREKLVLGLPEYGYEWPTSTLSVPSSTTGSGNARTYAYVKNNSSGNYSAGNYQWEPDSYTDVYAFNDGSNRQCLISLDSAWRKRLQHVRWTDIGGIGIWALGYDNGYTELWNAIESYMTDCYEDPCSGTIHDFGGPTRNYYNDEDYTWTIAPINAVSLDVDFSMFDLEANWDYLYVYDGPDTQSPQLAGSPFTGTNGPGQFTTSSGAVTFRFTSDISTVAPGFMATYVCNTQPAPVASFTSGALTVCAGDSLLLVSTSTDADSTAWSVSIGALSSMSGDSVYLILPTGGTVDVTLIVFNPSGTDQTTSTLNVQIAGAPAASIGISSNNVNLPNAVVMFSNSSVNATSYFWDFGDGSTSMDSQPWHAYTSAGVYDGFMVAMNDVCQPDTVFFQIAVGTAGLGEEVISDLLVFPNPFDDELTVSSESPLDEVRLYDLAGRPVPFQISQEGEKTIVRTQIAEGSYLLFVRRGEEIRVVPVVSR